MFTKLALEIGMVGAKECNSCNTKGKIPDICSLACGIGGIDDPLNTRSENQETSIFYLKKRTYARSFICLSN